MKEHTRSIQLQNGTSRKALKRRDEERKNQKKQGRQQKWRNRGASGEWKLADMRRASNSAGSQLATVNQS
jgi:hypothetical protein